MPRATATAAVLVVATSALLTLTPGPAAAATGGSNGGSATPDVAAGPTPPASPVVTAVVPDGLSAAPSFTVTGIVAGATLNCSVTQPAGGPAVTVQKCAAASKLDLVGGDDGTYTFSVSQTDKGKTSQVASATYRLDVNTPTITADTAVGSASTPTFTVANIDPDTTLQCSVTDPATVTVTTCGPSTAIDLGGAPDGTYPVTVDAEDASGDVSASATASYQYESSPPPAPIVMAPSEIGQDKTPTFTVSDSEDVDLTYTCTVAGLPPRDITSCGPSTTLDLTSAGDGSYNLDVTVTDGLNQTSDDSTAGYTLDTSTPAPVVALLSPASSPSSEIEPTFSISDPETLDGPDTFGCEWDAPDGSMIGVGPCRSGDAFGAGDGDGTYRLIVTATDGAGNSATAAPVPYIYESGPPPTPVVTIVGQPAGRGSSPSFQVTDSENVDLTYNCAVPGLPDSDITSCGPMTTLDLSSAADGRYQLNVTVTDGLGNVSAAGFATYTFDTVTPAPVVSLTAPLRSPSSDTTPSFAISDAERPDGPDTFSCVWTPPAGLPIAMPSCLSGATFPATRGNGVYTLSVTAQDSVGNTATAAPVSYVLEVGAPPAPVVTAASTLGNSPTPSFSVTDSENVDLTYNCSVAGLPAADVTSCGPTTTLDLSSAPDARYTLAVTVTDGLGQTSDPGLASYTLDTSTPAPVVMLRPPLVSPSSNATPIFSISDAETVSGPDTFSCVWAPPVGLPIDVTPCHNGEIFAAGEGDGDYTLSVSATDLAGNTSIAAPVTYTLDTVAPNAPTVALSTPTQSPGNVTDPQFTVTDPDSSPGAGLNYTCTVTGATAVPQSEISCGPTTTLDLTGRGRDGAYTLSVTATDSSGNASPAGTAMYTLDTTAPVAPTVRLVTPPASPGNVTTPGFTVSDVDHSPGNGLTFDCTVTGATPVPASAVTCGTSTTIDLTGANRDGSYTLSVTATDPAGNVSAVGTASYVLDTTAPLAPVIALPPSSTKLPTFGISDPDSTATLTCLLISPKNRTVFPTSGPGVCPANGAFDTTAFNDGAYTLTVTATDPAGNLTSTTVTWIRDTTAPSAPTVTLSAPAASPGNVRSLQFTVSDSDNSPVPGLTYTCSVAGPSPVPAAAISCGAPTTSVNLGAGAADGIYTLSVTATDAALNSSAPAGTATYALDTTAPNPPAVTLSSPTSSPGNDTSPQFTVSDSDDSPVSGLTYSCSVTGPTPVPASAISCAAPTTSIDLGGAGRDGTYVLSITATDTALNTSRSAGTATYTLDTSAPNPPTLTLSSPTSSPGNVTDPHFTVGDPDSSPGRGLTYSCSVTGATPVPASAISCEAPSTSLDLSGVGRDGGYSLSVTATDAAGNSSQAATAAYTLDTTAPLAPVVGLASATRSSSETPLWTWQFDFADVNTTLDTATCTLNGPGGWTATKFGCGRHVTMNLGGGDGAYTLTVTLTDEAGNTAVGTSPVYTLDSTAPAGPTAYLWRPIGGAGLSRHPLFVVKGPAASRLMCTLLQGGHDGKPVAPESVCPDPARYSLVGLPDGMFTLRVVAVDSVGNRSFPAWASYALIPPAPRVHPPTNQRIHSVWTVTGNPDDTFSCTLSHAGHAVAGPRACGGHPSFDMSPLPAGIYTLDAVQLGSAEVPSAPGSASWRWKGVVSPIAPITPTLPPAAHHPAAVKKPPAKPTTPLTVLPGAVRRAVHRISHLPSPLNLVYPRVHPNRVSEAVVSAVQGVVHEVGAAGGGTGFPLLLVGLVFAFLLAQNRIDRRDPKLALASVAADDMVEFHPPPSRRNRQ
ncbi:MAG TPA: hypothetical protein VHV79_09645 [Mycobacteriales bacterium]|nr:hypothetical protein [Mycobacteriales bacterium]